MYPRPTLTPPPRKATDNKTPKYHLSLGKPNKSCPTQAANRSGEISGLPLAPVATPHKNLWKFTSVRWNCQRQRPSGIQSGPDVSGVTPSHCPWNISFSCCLFFFFLSLRFFLFFCSLVAVFFFYFFFVWTTSGRYNKVISDRIINEILHDQWRLR